MNALRILGLLFAIATIATSQTISAQDVETAENRFKELLRLIEERKNEYMPCRVESIKTHPLVESHQWLRTSWFGNDEYVTEFGIGVPVVEAIKDNKQSSRYSELALGNASYFANVTIPRDLTTSDRYLLEGVREKEKLGFPHALHPVMDSMRIVGVFDDLNELLQQGNLDCSFAGKNNEVLVVRWNGSVQEQPIALELRFDLKHSRCLSQSRELPSETMETLFEFSGGNSIPSATIYRGDVNKKHKYEWRYDVVLVDKNPNASEACFLSFYDLPEPEFYHPPGGYWKILFGIILVGFALFFGIRFIRKT